MASENGLPDTLGELWQDELVSTQVSAQQIASLRDRLEATEYQGNANTVPAFYYEENPLDYVDVEAIVLDYSAVYALIGKEEWTGHDEQPEGWDQILQLFDTAYDDGRDTAIAIYVPDDIEQRLRLRFEDSTAVDLEEMADLYDAINEVTAPLHVYTEGVVTSNKEGLSASRNLAGAVRNGLKGNAVLATYDQRYGEGEITPRVPATTPRTLFDALTTDEGPYHVPAFNRLATIGNYLEWREKPAAQRVVTAEGEPGAIPWAYRNRPRDLDDIGSVVLDHSEIRAVLEDKELRDKDRTYEPTALLDVLENFERAGIPIYHLDNQHRHLRNGLKQPSYTEFIMEAVTDISTELPINEDIAVPEQYMPTENTTGSEEDYRIAATAAEEFGSETLILSLDGDFAEITDKVSKTYDEEISALPSPYLLEWFE